MNPGSNAIDGWRISIVVGLLEGAVGLLEGAVVGLLEGAVVGLLEGPGFEGSGLGAAVGRKLGGGVDGTEGMGLKADQSNI